MARMLCKLSGERKATERTVRALTVADYKALHYGQTLIVRDNAGIGATVRVSGQPKTWKTRPGDVKVPCKYGLYQNLYIGTVPGCQAAYCEVEE